MMSRLFKNWPWKILSLIFAIILWFMIINYQDPVTIKNIDNVKVDVINQDSIESKNMAVEYLEGKNVNLKVKGKRSVLNLLNKSDISVKADLSKVSVTGAIDLDVDLPVGMELVTKTPSMMMISIEQIRSTLKTAMPFYEGEVAEGYVKLQPTLRPNQVEITGTESKLALISSVIVPVSVENVKNDITVFVKPQILDIDGNEIEGLSTSSGTVELKLPVQKVEEKNIVLSSFGELSEDYRIISMKPSVPSVKLRGYEDELYTIKNIHISDIDLSTINNNTIKISRDLKNYLPEGVFLLDEQNFYIELKVVKLLEKEVEFPNSMIRFINTDENMNYKFIGEESVALTFKGTKEDLDKIDVTSLNPRVDLTGRVKPEDFISAIKLDLPDDVVILPKEPESSDSYEYFVTPFNEVMKYVRVTESKKENTEIENE